MSSSSTTTTNRSSIKGKQLTLLELCQTLNELQHTTPRNTAQMLTRRLYLHPLTISTNAKQHSSTILSNRSDFEMHRKPAKIDVWHALAQSLRRPIPKDPPTTPLD